MIFFSRQRSPKAGINYAQSARVMDLVESRYLVARDIHILIVQRSLLSYNIQRSKLQSCYLIQFGLK